MAIDLARLREQKLDPMTDKILMGLRERMFYPANMGVFCEHFADGESWFMDRLLHEQNLDSRHSRFEFQDQYPIIFDKEQLQPAVRARNVPNDGVRVVSIDLGHDVIESYMETIRQACEGKEDRDTYGECAKLDVNNVLLWHERINGVGRYVAQSKWDKHPQLRRNISEAGMLDYLVDSVREEEVLDEAVRKGALHGVADEELVRATFRRLIDLTVKAEVAYIKHLNPHYTAEEVGATQ